MEEARQKTTNVITGCQTVLTIEGIVLWLLNLGLERQTSLRV